MKPLSLDQILRERNTIDPKKATELDNISPRFLKDGAAQLAPLIRHIINLSIGTNIVPEELKHAKVTPLFKKNDRLEVSNYRPISVLSCISKVLEKCVHDQVQKYLISNDLIYEYQSGFRPGYSTESCLVYLTDYIKENIAKGYYVGALLLDVQKAFDCVNHEILCEKIKAIGIDPSWFAAYLSDRNQSVTIKDVSSDPLDITSGVPQGSLLGPLLYLIYSNDMVLSIKHKLLLYADDSVILVCDKNADVVSDALASELENCNSWLIDNKLSLHVGKTECILFGSKRRLKGIDKFTVKYKDCTIVSRDSVKYLGITLDSNLSGEKIVANISAKAIGKLKFLYRYGQVLSSQLRKKKCVSSHTMSLRLLLYFMV